MNTIIRQYTSDDYNDLAELLKQEYDSNIDQRILESKYLTNDRTVLVAVADNKNVIGCAFVEKIQDYIRPHSVLFITYVAVDRRYRNLGIGRSLFDRIEEMSKDMGISAIELTSANFRTGAHAFYDRIGFTKKKTTIFIKEVNN